jgi:hypothetical protein
MAIFAVFANIFQLLMLHFNAAPVATFGSQNILVAHIILLLICFFSGCFVYTNSFLISNAVS